MTREELIDLKNTFSVIILEHLMTATETTVAGLIQEIENNTYKIRPWMSLDSQEVGNWWMNVRANVNLTDFYMGVLAKLKHRWFMSEKEFADYLAHAAMSYTTKPSPGSRTDKVLARIPSETEALETLKKFPHFIIVILISDLSPADLVIPLLDEQKKKDDVKKRAAASQQGHQSNTFTR